MIDIHGANVKFIIDYIESEDWKVENVWVHFSLSHILNLTDKKNIIVYI